MYADFKITCVENGQIKTRCFKKCISGGHICQFLLIESKHAKGLEVQKKKEKKTK